MEKQSFFTLMIMMSFAHGDILDMTYILNEKAVYFKELAHFNRKLINNGTFEEAPYVYYNDLEISEHMGTHVDAPVHFALGGRMVNELKLTELHGPAVVIDIRKKAEKDSNACLELVDILAWEEEFGEIPKGAVIVQYSGWGQYWGDSEAYVGPQTTDGRLSIESPGLHPDAVNWLLQNRDINGFVMDTRSCDSGANTGTYLAHRAIMENDKWCVENGANIDKIPRHGSEIYILPMKVEYGSGGHVRMFSIWNEVAPWHNASAAKGGAIISFALISFTLFIHHLM
ncbi:unnamed protein product [Owenia fusiformis]|uniref:Uncharacterized protein n=1 Tax=Owenia fusiformis TaxID=6347 RepID=A0A8J1U399_OWEFU|nr:unnamed protein product [Owenia fusiformis]